MAALAASAMGLALAGPVQAAAAIGRPLVSEIPDDGVPTPTGDGVSARRAAPPAGIPAVDQIVSSPNVRQVANLPKQAPFTTPGSFGTDIAFQKDLVYVGNDDGFVVYDVRNPVQPRVVSQVLCPGSQNLRAVAGAERLPATARQDLRRRGAPGRSHEGGRRRRARPVPGRRQPRPRQRHHHRLPRHHGLPGEGPRRRCVHG